MKTSTRLAGALALAVGTVSVVDTRGSTHPPLPRPAPQLRAEPTADSVLNRNASCVHCHPAEAAEWQSSRHRIAYTNGEFQRALAREPASGRSFCVRCHAPEAPTDGSASRAHEIGVACVTCHVPLGPVLAAPSRRPAARAPHGLLRTASFRTAEACAGCHEFEFPGNGHGKMMQRTVTEHRESASADRGCAGCHMPTVGDGDDRHRSHSFPGGHDPELVRSALRIHAARPDPDLVRIELAPHDVTHAVPTGDLFRRLAVTVESDDVKRVRYLGRHFVPAPRGRNEVADNRVHLRPSVLEVVLPETAAGTEVRWSVRYERVAHFNGPDPEKATVDGFVLLAAGELPHREP